MARGVLYQRMRRLLILLTIVALACRRTGTLPAGGPRTGAEEVAVSAASSLQDAMRTIASTWERNSGDHVVLNFAGSSTLALQIRAGAPADVFLPADEATMDRVAFDAATRRTLLSNSLVVIANQPLKSPGDLVGLRRIALADPASVPAGVYGREWLERIGLWKKIEPKVIPTADVRAALAAVDAGNVDAAIVYRTDALLARHARVAFEVTGEAAPMIGYPIAVLRTARHPAAARRFWKFLQSDYALTVFRKYGFTTPGIAGPP